MRVIILVVLIVLLVGKLGLRCGRLVLGLRLGFRYSLLKFVVMYYVIDST